MIVVDSSALIAIFENEPDASIFATAIRQADRLLISAVNAHETGMLLRARRGKLAVSAMWRFLREDNDFEVVAFDEAQAREALSALDDMARVSIQKRGSTFAIARPKRLPRP